MHGFSHICSGVKGLVYGSLVGILRRDLDQLMQARSNFFLGSSVMLLRTRSQCGFRLQPEIGQACRVGHFEYALMLLGHADVMGRGLMLQLAVWTSSSFLQA